MNLVGIIAEYNPFHNGHIYHIKETIKKTNPDLVIAVISGPFTQQGNIAILDKFSRSKIASLYGADIVIEIPFVFASSSAEFFAKASINILNALNVNIVSFGSEEENIDTLIKTAKNILNNKDQINKLIKKYLKEGLSYTKSYILATEESLNLDNSNLFKSNNILALEYIKELIRLNSQIKPCSIHRIYNDYNENALSNSVFTSATSIRKSLRTVGNLPSVKKFVPEEIYSELEQSLICNNSNMYDILRYKIIINKDNLKNIHEVSEGFENRIYNNVLQYNNYEDFINNTITRRFTLPKLKRILIKILLDINKEDFNKIDIQNDLYARILYMNDKAKKHIGTIVKNSKIPVITKLNNKTLDSLSLNQKYLINKDIEANNLWNIINKKNLNTDFTNKL